MRSIKFNGFWCDFPEKVLDKVHDSFQPNPESNPESTNRRYRYPTYTDNTVTV